MESENSMQDSKLNLSIGNSICITLERRPGDPVEMVCFTGGEVTFLVRGEPFISSRKSVTDAILKEPEFFKLYESVDCL